MNKRIDFTKLGENPLDQQTFEFMQDSYRNALSAIAKLCGSKTILHGVEVTGTDVSAGWIAYNGELIPFIASGLDTDVVIQETSNLVTFKDGSQNAVEFTKVAFCGTPGNFPFADLIRLRPLKEMWLPGDIKWIDCDAAYITANFDASGLGKNERKGWAIRNGQNGTRDARGRFTVQWDDRSEDPTPFLPLENKIWNSLYNTPGATGGEQYHKLTIAEMPLHDHEGDTREPNTGGSAFGIGNGGFSGLAKTKKTGGDTPHNTLPPFMVSLSIVKLP